MANWKQIRKVTSSDENVLKYVFDTDSAVAEAVLYKLAVTFRKRLGDHGFSTRVFDPAGQDDIGGGCGQLFHVQNWMARNPGLAKPSVGSRLPVVHMPTLPTKGGDA